jgi:hypothetical protein
MTKRNVRKPKDKKVTLLIDGLPYSFVFSVSSNSHFPEKPHKYRKLAAWLIKAAEYLESK